MSLAEIMNKPKNRKVAALLAIASVVAPVHISGFHKFYVGQPVWGTVYLLLCFTPIPRIASAVEAVWYLFQDNDEFERRFALKPESEHLGTKTDPAKVGAIADAVRQIDQLRADGLISEYEFEQKRRQLLDHIS
jgi:TM2 domain-containing membrane protein YozV